MDIFQSRRIILDRVGDCPVVIFHDTASDRVRCFSTGKLPKSTALEIRGNQLFDPATGMAWDFSGNPADGAKDALPPVRVQRQWWLAWSEYHPGSLIYEEGVSKEELPNP